MTIYTIVSIIILSVLAFFLVLTAIRLFSKERSQRILFLKEFKHGNCFWAYLAALPMYFMGYVYGGTNWFLSIFLSINDSLSLVVLSYETDAVEALMANNTVYAIAVVATFLIITANAGLFIVALLDQIIWLRMGKKRFETTNKDRLLVVGYNQGNLQIYKSENNRQKALLCDFSLKEGGSLYTDDVLYLSSKDWQDYCKKVVQYCLNEEAGNTLVVINTQIDEQNVKIANAITNELKVIVQNCKTLAQQEAQNMSQSDAEKFIKDKVQKYCKKLFDKITVYVFGSTQDKTIYDEIVEDSFGCVRYVNKYTQIATDFIDNYPLTKFMDQRHVDYSTALVREDVAINVIGVGFGDVFRQILTLSVANNQFLTNNNGLCLKPVSYHVFDKENVSCDKNLNHTYYHYRNEFFDKKEDGSYQLKQEKQQGDYLPLPSLPAEERFYQVAVEHPDFYDKIKCITTAKNSVNVVVVCFGTDLENIDLAYKLLHMKQEWGVENLVVLVRVRTGKEHCAIFTRDDCFMFGDEENVVYNVDKIHNGKMEEMAKMCDRLYALQYDLSEKIAKAQKENNSDQEPIIEYTKEQIDAIVAQADYDWYAKKSQQERASNTYACLSLRSKLNLMGLDYSKEEVSSPITREQYFAVYDKENHINYGKNTIYDNKVVNYDVNFKDSLRTTLAVGEHYRWNSFMISCGTIPATKTAIEKETTTNEKGETKYTNGKNYQMRRHGNLTTFLGLVQFRQIVAKRKGCDEASCDVIKYDYQIMDNAHWLLTKHGYQIFKK